MLTSFLAGRAEQKHSWRDFAKISQKHVDFLLVDAGSLEPLMGVELDDSSHLTSKGHERDGFVNSVFKTAELPLHHIRASGRYDFQALRQELFGSGQNTAIYRLGHQAEAEGEKILKRSESDTSQSSSFTNTYEL